VAVCTGVYQWKLLSNSNKCIDLYAGDTDNGTGNKHAPSYPLSQAHIPIHHHITHTSSYPLSHVYIIICALSHGWLNISCTYVKNCIIIALSQRAQPLLCLYYYPRLLVIAGKNVEIWDCESPAPGPAPGPVPPPGPGPGPTPPPPAPPGPAPSSGKCCNEPCQSSTECASQLFC
jgi:hypothetical protein